MMDTTTGRTIYDQVSMSTKMAIGARNAVVSDKHVQCDVLNGRHKLIVTLEPSDTYRVSLCKWTRRGLTVTTLREVSDVYAENLSETVYRLCCQ